MRVIIIRRNTPIGWASLRKSLLENNHRMNILHLFRMKLGHQGILIIYSNSSYINQSCYALFVCIWQNEINYLFLFALIKIFINFNFS